MAYNAVQFHYMGGKSLTCGKLGKNIKFDFRLGLKKKIMPVGLEYVNNAILDCM